MSCPKITAEAAVKRKHSGEVSSEPAKKAPTHEEMSAGGQPASIEAGHASDEAMMSLVNANIGTNGDHAPGSQEVVSEAECAGAKEDVPPAPHAGQVEANGTMSLESPLDLFEGKKNSKQFYNIFNLKNSVQHNKMGIMKFFKKLINPKTNGGAKADVLNGTYNTDNSFISIDKREANFGINTSKIPIPILNTSASSFENFNPICTKWDISDPCLNAQSTNDCKFSNTFGIGTTLGV